MKLNDIVKFLNNKLELKKFSSDASNNGLQIEGGSEVTKVAYAVDASLATFQQTVEAGAELLIVHHGLSWGSEPRRFTGVTAKRLKTFFDNGVSLYAVHLPLDSHAVYGHNARLAEFIGLEDIKPFWYYCGNYIGYHGVLPQPKSLVELGEIFAEKLISPPQVKFYGEELERPATKVAIVSGGAGSDAVESAIAEGIDVIVTGEVTHPMYPLIMESGIRVISLGHYASETPGIIAIKELLEQELNLSGQFVDEPTGL